MFKPTPYNQKPVPTPYNQKPVQKKPEDLQRKDLCKIEQMFKPMPYNQKPQYKKKPEDLQVKELGYP